MLFSAHHIYTHIIAWGKSGATFANAVTKVAFFLDKYICSSLIKASIGESSLLQNKPIKKHNNNHIVQSRNQSTRKVSIASSSAIILTFWPDH